MPDEQAKTLAHAIEARQQIENEFAGVKAQFKDRLTRMDNLIGKLSHDILYGQAELPLEGANGHAVEKALDHMQQFAEQNGSKVTLVEPDGKETVLADGTKPKPKRHRPAPPPSEPAPF